MKSVGYSELFVLSREDVLEALKDHPEAEVKELFIFSQIKKMIIIAYLKNLITPNKCFNII